MGRAPQHQFELRPLDAFANDLELPTLAAGDPQHALWVHLNDIPSGEDAATRVNRIRVGAYNLSILPMPESHVHASHQQFACFSVERRASAFIDDSELNAGKHVTDRH